MIYGTAWKKEKTKELVEKAVTAGFRAIDTANQPKHYTESLVGEALQALEKKGVKRKDLFLQTKFTPLDGQDSRIPYNASAALSEQVEQSFKSSLEHLHTDYLDSYLLHGPYNYPTLGDEDFEVWTAFEAIYESKGAKQIGISNVNVNQLRMLLEKSKTKPMVVQNRCFARTGWDYAVRKLCRENKITYQGFSLLTANPEVLTNPLVIKIADRLKTNPEQVVYKFSVQIGITPLNGTTNLAHMKEDLALDKIELNEAELISMQEGFLLK